MDESKLAHELLDVYQLALGVARWAVTASVPAVRKHLRDQLVRAADSIVLNIAEASGRESGEARRNHFRIAAGSAAEVGAVLDLLDSPDAAKRKAEVVRIVRMLSKLARR